MDMLQIIALSLCVPALIAYGVFHIKNFIDLSRYVKKINNKEDIYYSFTGLYSIVRTEEFLYYIHSVSFLKSKISEKCLKYEDIKVLPDNELHQSSNSSISMTYSLDIYEKSIRHPIRLKFKDHDKFMDWKTPLIARSEKNKPSIIGDNNIINIGDNNTIKKYG